MRNLLAGLALVILLTGCTLFRGEGEVYSGYTCEKSLMHFYSYCTDKKFTKEEFEADVQFCEKEFATKICEKEQADLLWCMGRVAPGTYSQGGGVYSQGFYIGVGSASDGCDCSTFTGALKACRMQKGLFHSQRDESPQNKAQNITAGKDMQVVIPEDEKAITSPDSSKHEAKVSAQAYSSKATSSKQFKPEAINRTEESMKFAVSKNWSEMIRTASVAIQIDPSYPEAYVSRSWGYLEKGFPDKALADCQKALELDINNVGAYNNRGLYYLRSGDQAKAREDFEKACHGGLEIGCGNFKLITGYKPSEKMAYLLNKAEDAFNAKNWDEVIRCTSEIPGDATALSVRAGAYAYKGMFEEAIKDCDHAIRINPDYPLPYNNKAFALQLKGNKQEAILNYEFACNLKMDLACKNMKALENKK